jgi:hypothetical protein
LQTKLSTNILQTKLSTNILQTKLSTKSFRTKLSAILPTANCQLSAILPTANCQLSWQNENYLSAADQSIIRRRFEEEFLPEDFHFRHIVRRDASPASPCKKHI